MMSDNGEIKAIKADKISIAIVTYNNATIIADALAALLAIMDDDVAVSQLLVIDNHSTDTTIAVLQPDLMDERISLIENTTNYGFGAGHNQAIKQTDATYHIICNPDIVINGNTIPAMLAYLDQHPNIGILSPKLMNVDGSLQPNNHKHPTLLDLALRRLAPAWLKARLKKRMDAYLLLDVGYDAVCDVPFLSGAFMICRTEVLKQVAGFDERYFLYFEDADLCRKVQAAGYRTVYFPDASVIHHWERAAYKSWRMTWIMLQSAIKYFNKWGYQWY
jgi:GT2 family glycosyltransferase